MEDKKNEFSDWEQINKNEIDSKEKKNILDSKINEEINIYEDNVKYQESNINIEEEKQEFLKNLNIFLHQFKKDDSNIENKIIEGQDKEEAKSIIYEYFENNNILSNKDKLISFIDELSFILKSGDNTIVPFLNLCPILIKSYIESDIDEEKGVTELKYVKIFELLKYNSFISREYLYYIYEYFGHLYYLKDTIEETDKRLNKFIKIIELWNIFYNFEPENEPKIGNNLGKNNQGEQHIKTQSMKYNTSSFCFLGSGLKFIFNSVMNAEDCLCLDIYFGKTFEELNNDLILISLKNDKNTFDISFSELKEKLESNIFPKTLKISIIQNQIQINVDKNINEYIFSRDYTYYKELYLLSNFYGQIEKIEINLSLIKKNQIFTFNMTPYLLNNNELVYDNAFIKSIKFTKPKCSNVNYINYLDSYFDLEEYFLGIIPLMPFVPLINGLYYNSKIKNINGIDKINVLIEAFRKIILNFLSIICIKKYGRAIISKGKKKSKKNLDKITANEIKATEKAMEEILKYDLFVFNFILELPLEFLLRQLYVSYGDHNSFTNKLVEMQYKIYPQRLEGAIFFIKLLNSDEDDNSLYDEQFMKDIGTKLSSDLSANDPLLYESSYQQLYRKLMKELFIYNRLWSVKEFFFQNDDSYFSKLKLKYKQISYYTKSLEQPYLYPVLEINEYIPSFNKFDKKNLFNHTFEETVNYDFNLKEGKFFQIIKEKLDEKVDKNKERYIIECCLVKKGYHVKGKISRDEVKNTLNNSNNKEYILTFESYEDNTKTMCNKKNINRQKKKIDELCYGAVFECPKKEMNRKIRIRFEDINLILIRNYYKATSAIEIFTTKRNKSYYFNFHGPFKDKNNLFKILDGIAFFQKIKLNNRKYLGGYYNKNQNNLLFSIFSGELPNSIFNNMEFFNRYDIMILINMFANRSFKDLYQYPVFPILYKTSKILENEKYKERDLSKHLGLQEISQKSELRTKLIRSISDDFDEDYSRRGTSNYLFNIHYSNPIFICNYLIRIFPYSLSSIEYQGDGFDSPNRQSYSIIKTLENTLIQKSDLRENIPEFFYFTDLFFNRNNLKLGILSTGEEIDDMYIKEKKEEKIDKYKYLAELKNYFLYDKKLDLNYWIDLIFGINQEKSKEIGREYYSKEKYIHLNKREQESEINNPSLLELVEFGLQPLKIFETNFPYFKDMEKYKTDWINYNLNEFYNSHLIIKNNKEICFIFELDEYQNLKKYINYIMNEEIATKFDFGKLTYNKYRFIGNIYGDVIIYQSKIVRNNINNNEDLDKNEIGGFFARTNPNHENIIKCQDKIVNKFMIGKNNDEIILTKLRDHYRQIKYIDYNPRLNLLLTYALDGYIHLYIFPICKLIRTIKVKDITKSDDALQKVVLISNLYPMIFLNDEKYIYILSINGDLINKKEKKKNSKFFACIDKNLGLFSDSIFEIYDKTGNNNFDTNEIDLPLFIYKNK